MALWDLYNPGKVFIAPCVEGYYYGFDDGFMNGWEKSGILLIKLGKQILAASADFDFSSAYYSFIRNQYSFNSCTLSRYYRIIYQNPVYFRQH